MASRERKSEFPAAAPRGQGAVVRGPATRPTKTTGKTVT